MKLEQMHLTIVGLGLMGGSLARALRRLGPKLTGVDSDPETVRLAAELGVVDQASSHLASGLGMCDLAVLAVPVRTCVELIRRMGRDLPVPPRLLDLGSTKSEILNAMHDLPTSCDPIGGHPMCGKESAGLLSSDPSLYRGAVFALSPLERTSSGLVQFAQGLARAVGARPLLMPAHAHDRLVAFSSHLPYLLAAGLVATLEPIGAEDSRLWDLLGPGFRDTSRLAAGEVGMMMDILSTNRRHVEEALDRMIDVLEGMRSAMRAGEEQILVNRLEIARRRRRGLPFQASRSQA
jgi:prephenate dehydrogenase